MVHDCWLVRSELFLQTLLTSRGPDGGLRVAPDHGSLSREASAPMVAVLADQGLSAGSVQRAPGIGPDGRVVVVQTKLPLRHGDRLTFRRWDADFNNCASKGLTIVGWCVQTGMRAVRRPPSAFAGPSEAGALVAHSPYSGRRRFHLGRPHLSLIHI